MGLLQLIVYFECWEQAWGNSTSERAGLSTAGDWDVPHNKLRAA